MDFVGHGRISAPATDAAHDMLLPPIMRRFGGRWRRARNGRAARLSVGGLGLPPDPGHPAPSWRRNDLVERADRPDQNARSSWCGELWGEGRRRRTWLRAFKIVTADGAARGLEALGSTDEAAALGLTAFGPVAAGAEPGIGSCPG